MTGGREREVVGPRKARFGSWFERRDPLQSPPARQGPHRQRLVTGTANAYIPGFGCVRRVWGGWVGMSYVVCVGLGRIAANAHFRSVWICFPRSGVGGSSYSLNRKSAIAGLFFIQPIPRALTSNGNLLWPNSILNSSACATLDLPARSVPQSTRTSRRHELN